MKSKICALIAISAIGLSTSAFAGEGGIAGAVSFQFDGTSVTNASSAIAVGKDTAYAATKTDTPAGATEAFAAGSAGVMTFQAAGSIYIDNIASDLNADLGTAQANTLAATNVNSLNSATGTLTQTTSP